MTTTHPTLPFSSIGAMLEAFTGIVRVRDGERP